jgi:hypothetical protein
MKKCLVFLIILLAAFSGCSMIYVGQEDWDYYTPCSYTPASFEELESWVYTEIAYEKDLDQYDARDYWATPAETLASMRGDCEDSALLLGYIAQTVFSLKPTFLLLLNPEDMNDWHIVVTFEGYFYYRWQDRNYHYANWIIFKRYNYGQAMWIAENTHGQGILGKSIQ